MSSAQLVVCLKESVWIDDKLNIILAAVVCRIVCRSN